MNGTNTCTAAQVPPYLECQVCFDAFCEPTQLLPCGHIFCRHCITASVTQCPTCRGHVGDKQCPNDSIMNAAEQVPVLCSSCGWRGTRKQSMAHRCDVRDTNTVYDKYPQHSDQEWMRLAKGGNSNNNNNNNGAAVGGAPPAYDGQAHRGGVVNGIPLQDPGRR